MFGIEFFWKIQEAIFLLAGPTTGGWEKSNFYPSLKTNSWPSCRWETNVRLSGVYESANVTLREGTLPRTNQDFYEGRWILV